MLFNSFDFAVFLPIVFFVYWFVLRFDRRAQNAWLLAASYLFYGWWDWRFLTLIAFSTLVDYGIGYFLGKEENPLRRKLLLGLSVGVNLGLLGFFKYFHFFVDNFVAAFTLFGSEIEPFSLKIILPVGISFYTFQTLSYTLDIYRKQLKPTSNLLEFAAFVSFFPQLVAGPIERARDLLPQFQQDRVFDEPKAIDGLKQILWGLAKKVIIADNCARTITYMFENPTNVESGDLFLGLIFLAFQMYGDFSGYSDIAIGTARLFGFRLTQNFAFPYFSRNIGEFWRRWHITLTTWLRDYLYIPLGGNRKGMVRTVINTLLTFLICGFWHGSDWRFVVWGGVHALYFIPFLLLQKQRPSREIVAKDKRFPSLRESGGMLLTFLFIAFSCVFLRATSIEHAFQVVHLTVVDPLSWFAWPIYAKYKYLLLTLGLFMGIEWVGRREQFGIAKFGWNWPRPIRWTFYVAILILIVYYLFTQQGYQFVYFHF